MRRLSLVILAALSLTSVPAFADNWVRDILSSGATTASIYLTFKDKKLIVPAQDDASSYVASGGQIRGPYLEAALQRLRAEHPDLQASDMELASAILTAQ
ncbi:ribonucleotide reductase [Pseudomonas taeanensis MS-3]|jgi:uncharacterized protein (TIGR02448 family)|uniref:Ribonucleotide reductase n=1 Tax=Pseudomonas taeanensis MS-3 TaxID=1395571 RepID=A0A0A1YMQ0_9PSED|nr:DUF2388 domain-containing protein [Pseudomonas taeanensis]KFX71202.1 ribonucleotide reductase [Pseudomonas taeanensis MS-3]